MESPDLGPYTGAVAPAFREENFLAELGRLRDHLPRDGGGGGRRNVVVRAELACNGRALPLAVKAFPPQGRIRSFLARKFGSKARQAWEVATALHERGIGTPRPVALLERWEDGLLRESYFVTEFEADTLNFNAELLRLFKDDPIYWKILALLDTVAAAVRKMHDAGVQHGDMGNQNILVRRLGDGEYGDVRFLDVNRGKVADELSMRDRAFDLSRITLPSRLLNIFRWMYFREYWHAGERPPKELHAWERRYRRRFALHSRTRPLRHPLRERRRAREKRARGDGWPARPDIWIWDAHSDQAIGTMVKKERYRYVSLVSMIWVTLRLILTSPPLFWHFPKLRRKRYAAEVPLRGRLGMTLSPKPETVEREYALLKEIGEGLPILLRFYHHESEKEWAFVAAHARRLHEDGYPVSIALVQDRKAVHDGASWQAFVARVLELTADVAEWVEVGHATNRVKWGIWRLADYAKLLAPFPAFQRQYPRLKWMGPAINDFEFHYVGATLARVPKGFRFDALSTHLYVDRRGPPEGRQRVLGTFTFDGVDKFVLARTLARTSRKCKEAVIISEVNWFLKRAGGDASPFAPFHWHGDGRVDPSATEDEYASWMIRYYVHALCSGMVEIVYWWRLVAQGFGLVADGEGDEWRRRPAFHTFRTFVRLLGDTTYEARLSEPDAEVHVFRFRRPDGGHVVLAFTSEGAHDFRPDFAYDEVVDRAGSPLTPVGGVLRLDGDPVYFSGVS